MRTIRLLSVSCALILQWVHVDAFVVNPGYAKLLKKPAQATPTIVDASLRRKVLEPSITTTAERSSDFQGGVLASVALFNSSRVVRLAAVAWVLGEFFSWIGFFEENATVAVLGGNLKEKMEDLRWGAEEWWATARCEGGLLNSTTWRDSGIQETVSSKLYNLSLKHRFAVGAGVGLFCSQAALGVAKRVLKLVILLYTVSEVTNLIAEDQPQHSYRNTTVWTKATETVNNSLTGLRLAVRNAIMSPKGVLVKVQSWFQETNDGQPPVLPRDTLRGFVVGTVTSFLF